MPFVAAASVCPCAEGSREYSMTFGCSSSWTKSVASRRGPSGSGRCKRPDRSGDGVALTGFAHCAAARPRSVTRLLVKRIWHDCAGFAPLSWVGTPAKSWGVDSIRLDLAGRSSPQPAQVLRSARWSLGSVYRTSAGDGRGAARCVAASAARADAAGARAACESRHTCVLAYVWNWSETFCR
jgi:hypothetical protein